MNQGRRDVIVVGAGFAGLTAASQIIAASRSVIVLEARARPGGRAHTLQTRQGSIDLGATWFWPNEDDVAEALRSAGEAFFSQFSAGSAILEAEEFGLRRLPSNALNSEALRFSRGAGHLAERLATALPAGSLAFEQAVRRIDVKRNRVRVRTDSDIALSSVGPFREFQQVPAPHTTQSPPWRRGACHMVLDDADHTRHNRRYGENEHNGEGEGVHGDALILGEDDHACSTDTGYPEPPAGSELPIQDRPRDETDKGKDRGTTAGATIGSRPTHVLKIR